MQLVLLVCLVQLWLCLVYSNGASLPAMATKSRYVERNKIRGGMTAIKPLQASVVSWNMAEKAPTDDGCSFMKLYRDDDIVVFGIQECENIRPRRNEGHRSRKWRSIQSKMLGRSFRCIARHKMGGLLLAVYIRKTLSKEIEGLQISDVACGVGNVLTNKGAVSVVLRIRDKTVALINSHLAAHQSHVQQRNADYARIMEAVVESIPSEWKAKQHREEISMLDEDDDNDAEHSLRSTRTRLSRRGVAHQLRAPFGAHKSPLKTLTKHFSTITTKTRKTYKAPGARSKPSSRGVQSVRRAQEIPIDSVLFFGDLNYRVEKPRQEIESLHKQILKSSAIGGSRKSRASEVNADTQRDIDSAPQNRTSISNNYFKHTPAEQRLLLENKLDRLLRSDQLNQQRRFGRVLQSFREGNIRFPPTYKYDKGADQFDTSAKQRCPAWTDRILYYTRASRISAEGGQQVSSAEMVEGLTSGCSESEATLAEADGVTCVGEAGVKEESKGVQKGGVEVVELVDYYSVDVRTSDHRPVCATFRLHL